MSRTAVACSSRNAADRHRSRRSSIVPPLKAAQQRTEAEHASPLQPRSWFAPHNIGNHLIGAGRPAVAFHQPGRYAEGAAVLAEALAQQGEDAVLLYDLACFECLAGDTSAALTHARRAIGLDPGLRAGMAVDSDFAALADDSGFRALVGS